MIIHQIFISDGTDPDENSQLEENKIKFESFYLNDEYRLWRNQDILNFMNEIYPDMIVPYNRLQSYASKADLARLLILNHFGGWYYDFYTHPLIEIDVSDKEMVFFSDIQENTNTSFAVANGLFYSVKNNPVLQTGIALILSNISQLYYGGNPLCASSTVPFGRAIAIHGYNSKHIVGRHKEIDGRRVFVLPDESIFANGKSLPGGEIALSGTNSYNKIWHEKNYYGEKNF